MRQEFMLYIRNAGDAKKELTEDAHLSFIKECEVYIAQLKAGGNLIAAQPIVREGFVIQKHNDEWTKSVIDPSKEVQVGYYHIIAKDMEEAIEIAKDNPEFRYVPSASIEVRPVKTKESQTGFVYPK